MRIFLISHGETTGDLEDRYGGWYNDSLSEKGKKQSLELADRLMDKNIHKIFTTPLKRAQQTARIISQATNTQVKTIENLAERHTYGVLTGMKKEEAKEKFPEEVEELEAKNPYHKVKESENYFDFAERIIKEFNEIIEKEFSHGEPIAFVTHGGPINVFFREILGFEVRGIKECALIELEYDGEGYEIIDRNDLEKIWSED